LEICDRLVTIIFASRCQLSDLIESLFHADLASESSWKYQSVNVSKLYSGCSLIALFTRVVSLAEVGGSLYAVIRSMAVGSMAELKMISCLVTKVYKL
jgi:hypothetical protein